MIVSDIEATAQRYHEVLGVPLPSIQTTLGDSTYKGQPSSATAKLAFMNFGQVTIELIQPDEQPSVWRDYLNARGEGAQHIAFQIGDTQQVGRALRRKRDRGGAAGLVQRQERHVHLHGERRRARYDD